MTQATLVRKRMLAKIRGNDGISIPQAEILFKGPLADAIAAARAIPAAERLEVTLETEDAYYGPDDFDEMTPDHLPLRDFDIVEGRSIVRLEKGALELLRGDRRMMPPASIINDQIDVVTAILRHKKTIDDVEELDGKRMIRITATDIEAA
jgi:hypothetical protein